jgi:hypothetical protein
MREPPRTAQAHAFEQYKGYPRANAHRGVHLKDSPANALARLRAPALSPSGDYWARARGACVSFSQMRATVKGKTEKERRIYTGTTETPQRDRVTDMRIIKYPSSLSLSLSLSLSSSFFLSFDR